jgi:hypothetical protein
MALSKSNFVFVDITRKRRNMIVPEALGLSALNKYV